MPRPKSPVKPVQIKWPPWTAEEDEVLCAVYPAEGWVGVAKALPLAGPKRTHAAIKNRAYTIGLVWEGKRASSRGKAVDDIIRERYPTTGAKGLEPVLGMKAKQISSRAYKLGVSVTRQPKQSRSRFRPLEAVAEHVEAVCGMPVAAALGACFLDTESLHRASQMLACDGAAVSVRMMEDWMARTGHTRETLVEAYRQSLRRRA